MGLQQYGSNFPKEVFDPTQVEHPSDFYDASGHEKSMLFGVRAECERPPPPKRSKKACVQGVSSILELQTAKEY